MTEDGTSSSVASNTHNSFILSFFFSLSSSTSLPPLAEQPCDLRSDLKKKKNSRCLRCLALCLQPPKTTGASKVLEMREQKKRGRSQHPDVGVVMIHFNCSSTRPQLFSSRLCLGFFSFLYLSVCLSAAPD